MAMISKNAKQPMEGKASATAPWGAAEGAKKTGSGSDGGAWAADMRAPSPYGNFRTGDNIPGKKGGMAPSAKVANEAGKGFGGRVIKDME